MNFQWIVNGNKCLLLFRQVIAWDVEIKRFRIYGMFFRGLLFVIQVEQVCFHRFLLDWKGELLVEIEE